MLSRKGHVKNTDLYLNLFEKPVLFRSNLEYQNGIPGLCKLVNEGGLMGITPSAVLSVRSCFLDLNFP